MDAPAWRPPARRRPHSAGSVSMETVGVTSRAVAMETGRPPSRPDRLTREHASPSQDLDFTDKLKALRELITSSKVHKETRKSSADRSGSRIIAKRTDVPNFCNAEKVDEKIKFSASSFERRELATRAHNLQVNGGHATKDDEFNDELSVDSDDEKYSPQRPMSAFRSHDHLTSRDFSRFDYTDKLIDRDFGSGTHGMRVKVERAEKERRHSSLGLHGRDHEVMDIPERDWNIPSRTSNTFPDSEDRYLQKASRNTKSSAEESYGDSVVVNGVDEFCVSSAKDPHRHRKWSPPERDYSLSMDGEKHIQTNVKISGRKPPMPSRPHSAEPSRSRVFTDMNGCPEFHAEGGQGAKEAGHWTQLLSQRRDKSEHSRSVPSSPVQSNVSLDLPSRASPYAYLLQQAMKHHDINDLNPDRSNESSAPVDHDKIPEKQGKSRLKKKSRDPATVAESLIRDYKTTGEERLQDDEVAAIMDHPRPKKRIIVKRSSVKAAGDQQTEKRQHTDHQKHKSEGKSSVARYSADSDNHSHDERGLTTPVITKDDHLMTLDKLRAALRGRRSDSRPSSCASSLSMTSPSPLKAVHVAGHLLSEEETGRRSTGPRMNKASHDSKHQEPVPEKHAPDGVGDGSSKPVQRRIIRRPPSGPYPSSKDSSGPGKSLLPSRESSSTHSRGRILEGEVPLSKLSSESLASRDLQQKRERVSEVRTRTDRPTSAPHLVPLSSPRTVHGPSRTCQERDSSRTRTPSSSPVKQTSVSGSTGRASQVQASRRSRSSTDFTHQERKNDLASAQALRSNVQRLHQEVSMRVQQDAYIMQNLMSKVNGLDLNGLDRDDLDPDGKSAERNCVETEAIRRRLSFDEDGAVAEENKTTAVSRSKSCIPFGAEGRDVRHVFPSRAFEGENVVQGVGKSLYDETDSAGAGHQEGIDRHLELVTSTPVNKQRLAGTGLSGAAHNGNTKRGLNVSQMPQSGQPIQKAVNGQGPYVAGNLRPSGVEHKEEFTSVFTERSGAGSGMMTGELQRPSRQGGSSAEQNLWRLRQQGFQTNSTLSGKDAADTILSQLGNASMVHLLQQLYTADDQTRQAIITKAEFFKRWQSTAHCMKLQRQVYTESLHRAQVYLVSKLRLRYFHIWRNSAEENRKNRAADAIFRHHMLRKGLQAFSWAITRSKHQRNTLKLRMNAISLKASFTKWHTRAAALREERMRVAFIRWREFTREEKSVREMQRTQNEKLVCQTMDVWRHALDRRVKENLADHYLRLTLLRHSWQTWCEFTRASREKAHRQHTAENLCKRNLQRTTLHRMRTALHQSRVARQHFRMKRLKRMLQGWRHGAQVSRVERQRDMATSLEHWRHTTTRHTFIRWCQQLHHRRATVMANNNLSRKTFEHWRQVWRINMERRQEIEAVITRSRLHKCLLTWRRNVVDRRRKQKQAVMLLESCLMRGTLLAWKGYTAYKTGFRASLQLHVKVIERTKMSRCFNIWKDSLHNRLDERRRHELWSLSCVRKAVTRWKHTCHLRRLEDILCETQPDRELGLIRRMFRRWLAARDKAEEENAEVVSLRHILQRCSLQRQFQAWRLATQRALTVKPLIQRRQRMLVTWCFDAWHEYVQGRVQLSRNRELFQRNQLARRFARWRRQQQCQQIARSAQQSSLQRLTRCLLLEWRDVLRRKHVAAKFNQRNLLRRTFYHWSHRSMQQLEQRREQHAQQELSQRLKRQYFDAWWSGVHRQIEANNEAVAHLQQRQAHNHIRSAFVGWRRSLHAHVIMRAYQRSASLRLQRSVLLEWHATASHSLSSAVQHFVQQLGLDDNMEADTTSNSFGELLTLEDADHLDSPRSSSTTSLNTSVRRLFSSESERYMDGDLDRMSLLNKGLTETLEGRRNKNQRLQEITLTFVTRLSHWPISLAFNQWCEYTMRQCELRQLSQQVKDMRRSLTMAMTLRHWRLQHINSQKAAAFRNTKLLSNSLLVLHEYSQQRKAKALLAEKARGHLVKHVLSKVFPKWLAKAQEQRHERSILHLWTTATPEETELLPLEMSLSRQIRQRSLKECFSIWYLRFQFLTRLKNTYHKQLLGRVMAGWQEWASVRQGQRTKGEHFLQARRKSLVFRTWCERLHQKRETEIRYHAAWQGYVRLIFRSWKDWASVSKQHRLASVALEGKQNRNCLAAKFATWRRLTERAQTVRTAQQARLISRVFCGWRQVTQEGKQLRQVTLAFQANCLARLAGCLFRKWRQRYQDRLRAQRRRQELAEQHALHCGRVWRKKAQNTRGRKLKVVFKYSRMSRMFTHWRSALERVQELKSRQEAYMVEKNKALLRRLLVEWHQKLQSAVIMRSFTQKLLATVLGAWRSQAHASRERRIRGLALQKAIHEQNLRSYFLYWRDLTVRVRSLQNNVEVKLQLRVLQAWRYTVRRRRSQRRTGEKLFALRQHRQMASAFMMLRCRFDYCQGLQEAAENVRTDKEKTLASRVLSHWKDRYDRRLAARFYTHLLSVRTATRWQQYVVRMKAERQYEALQHQRAVTHHNKHICSLVLEGLKREVTVSRQLRRRQLRLAFKFAISWKRITDMAITASIMVQEKLYAKYWRIWRLERVRRQVCLREEALERRQILSQVFTAWCSMCPSRAQLQQQLSWNRRPRALASETRCDSPTTPRSFLPVPVGSSRKTSSDSAPYS